jgi:glutamate-1-semialdehyde 2,1-aminomutase
MDGANYSFRLNKVIPGGAHTYSRGDDQYPSNAPQIFARGEGAYSFTPEGTGYLDYGMALRAVTLGYGNQEVNDAAIREILKGNNLTRPSTIELEAAELITALIPAAEMVKFAKNGSNATTAAVKIARAYTGRKYIVRCHDHPFFSFDDWFIGDTPIVRGIPEEFQSLTLHFKYNDAQSLANIFDEFPGQIAGVILEPATTSHPENGFLHKVRDLCHKNGAIFILDEMITGFRWHLKGAQAYYEVEPDLCTFGKGMANGFSVAALCGKTEFMKIGSINTLGAERVFLNSTTHGAEMCGLGAFVKTVEIYQRDNVIDHLWQYGGQLIDGLNQQAREVGVAEYFEASGIPCSPQYVTKDADGQISLPLRTLFSQEMIKSGILMPWIALSYSHGEAELRKTLMAARDALQIYKQALTNGIDHYLVGPTIKPVFRKSN